MPYNRDKTRFYVKTPDIADKRYHSGRFVPVFPSILQGTKKEEEYIERMIARDRNCG